MPKIGQVLEYFGKIAGGALVVQQVLLFLSG